MIPHDDERPMFLLGPIAATLRWLEELANLVSGPLLVAGLAIALIDLLTDGQLLAAAPALLYAWAIAQAIGVDAQLVGAWDRAKRAMLRRHWWHLLGLLVLGAVLAYVAYVAGLVFATQEANHVTEAQALASLGMNATTWLWQRVGVSVFLVCLSGFTRYRAPRQTTMEDERAKLQRELELEPLRQRVRGVKLAGVRAAATALAGAPVQAATLTPVAEAITPPTAADAASDVPTTLQEGAQPLDAVPVMTAQADASAPLQRVAQPQDGALTQGYVSRADAPDETPSPTPPTGPGSPITAPSTRRQHRASQPAILRLTPDRPRRRGERQAAQAGVRTPGTTGANESFEVVARQAFAGGATSIPKMRRATGMGQSAAQSWVRTLKAEQAATNGAPNVGQRIMLAPTLPLAAQRQPLPGSAFRGVLADDDMDDMDNVNASESDDYAL